MAAITFPAPTQLKNLLDPAVGTDAATKEYVDNAFTSINNLSLGNLTATGNVNASYFNGDGSNISNVSVSVANVTGIGNIATLNLDGNSTNVLYGNGTFAALGATANSNYANYAGNVVNASQPNITSVGNLTSLIVVGNLSSGNANLGNLVSANYIKGNGSLITYITGANVSGYVPNANVANTAYAVSGGNVSGQVSNALVAGTVYTNAQPNITSVGTLTSLAVTGNITAGNIAGGNLVSANYFVGNGSLLTGLSTLTSTVDTFTGDGSSVNFNLSTTPSSVNYTLVAVGGVLQPRSYYSVSGGSITFSTAPPSTAPIEVTTIGGSVQNPSSTNILWNIISANTTLAAGNGYFIDTTSSAITVTLPSSPTLGQTIKIDDLAGKFATNNLTIAGGGSKIQGSASNWVASTNQENFTLVYSNSTYGWKLLA
jgi:hypothetical protein